MSVPSRRATAALAALSVAAFCFVTTEVMPIGLLTLIAADLHRSASQTGLLVTGYAVVVVLASLPLARLTHQVPRRQLLAGSLAVLAAATVAAAVSPGYGVLLGARLVTALAQAMFWSVVASTATGLFPPQVRGRMVARLAMGNSLAPVLGVPAGTWLGQQAGWRTAFVVLAGISLATCAAVAVLVPTIAPRHGGAARGTAPDLRRYAVLLVITGLGVTGAIGAFTYITPFLLEVSGFAASSLGPLLFVSGLAGVLGTVAIGSILDRHPWAALIAPLTVVTGALLGLYALGPQKLAAVSLLAGAGLAFSALAAAIQHRVLQVAPGSTDIASAGGSAAFNVGIASGSFLGAVLIPHLGVRSMALAGGILTAAALAAALGEARLTPRSRRPDAAGPMPPSAHSRPAPRPA
jgi:predicted MFS family arabinose efflux permease